MFHMIRVACISDTHEMHRSISIPSVDLLLHAGDLTFQGDPEKVIEFNDWCGSLIVGGIAKQIMCIAGNHDFLFQNHPEKAASLITKAVYLEDSSYSFSGLRIHGTPWQPWFYVWAFNLKT